MFEPLNIEPELVDIVRTVHAERQPPPPKPVISVMSFDENFLGDETIDATGFLDTLIPYIPKIKEIPEITTCPELDTFIPYDEPPSLMGGLEALKKNLKYPEMARMAGMEGSAYVKVLISESCDVLKNGNSRESGTVGFGKAAEEAVIFCKFKPARQCDRAVKVFMTIPVVFRIHQGAYHVY